jgi:hypothetical protein
MQLESKLFVTFVVVCSTFISRDSIFIFQTHQLLVSMVDATPVPIAAPINVVTRAPGVVTIFSLHYGDSWY